MPNRAADSRVVVSGNMSRNWFPTAANGMMSAIVVRFSTLRVMSRQPISQRGEARIRSSSAKANISSAVRNGGTEFRSSPYCSKEANDCRRAKESTAYQAVLECGPDSILSIGSAGR